MKQKRNLFFSKFAESILSILPIFIAVLCLAAFVSPLSDSDYVTFIIASAFLVIGIFLFNTGAESSMLVMGENIGGTLSKSRRLTLFIVSAFVLSLIVTIAEPDLVVFATRVAQDYKWFFILSVGVGVGLLTTLAVMRIVFQIKISVILFIGYALILLLMLVVPADFVSVAFDASGVTTGPISSPFLLAFGLGVSAVRASKNSQQDSFGLIAISSIGPILIVLFMGLFTGLTPAGADSFATSSTLITSSEIFTNFIGAFVKYLKEIGLIIGAILFIFIIFDIKMLKLPKSRIYKLLIGLLFTYIGIVTYLTGVTVGYLPISSIIGYNVFTWGGYYLLIPLMIIIGFAIVAAEPAVHVLNKKVYEITNGVISKRVMFISIAISVVVALIISVFKVIYQIDIVYILLPLYSLVLLLMLFSPQIFVSIAFDSGGVASGPMSGSFILPFVSGLALSLGQLTANSALGVIAIVSSTPLLTIQILGIIFKVVKNKEIANQNKIAKRRRSSVEIINFGE